MVTTKTKVLVSAFLLSFILLGVAAAIAYVSFSEVEGMLVLHYDSSGEVDIAGTVKTLYNILVVAGVILVVNAILAYELWDRERILSYLFSGASVFFSILILIFLVFVTSFN